MGEPSAHEKRVCLQRGLGEPLRGPAGRTQTRFRSDPQGWKGKLFLAERVVFGQNKEINEYKTKR